MRNERGENIIHNDPFTEYLEQKTIELKVRIALAKTVNKMLKHSDQYIKERLKKEREES